MTRSTKKSEYLIPPIAVQGPKPISTCQFSPGLREVVIEDDFLLFFMDATSPGSILGSRGRFWIWTVRVPKRLICLINESDLVKPVARRMLSRESVIT